MPAGIHLPTQQTSVAPSFGPAIGVRIGKAGAIQELSQDPLVKTRRKQVFLSGVTHIDPTEVSKGGTVGNSSRNHRNPRPLTPEEKLTKPTLEKAELANVILKQGPRAHLEPKLVESLAQDFGERVERRSVLAEWPLIQVQNEFGVTPKAPGISNGLKGSENLGVNGEPLKAALQVRAGAGLLDT